MDLIGTRRDALLLGLGAAAGTVTAAVAGAGPVSDARCAATDDVRAWKKGTEGQRRADLGNGTYRNPVLAGDHPDPSVLKDGDGYYLVNSSFHAYPGLVIWRSADLVNWTPIGPALHKVLGSVLAPDLVKHAGRYFIYFAVLNLALPFGSGPAPYGKNVPMITNYVVHADAVAGPWSDPVELQHPMIDPGHAVGEDGRRYLFFADGYRRRLADDGLSFQGGVEKVYGGWPIPPDWIVEGFSLEGPKVMRRGDWFYAFWAEGGTAGPPTSHMIVVARSRSINGPWENCPHNPIVHTGSAGEPWWSRGHGTPVEGPSGDWWLVYHGYENGFRTLGRQTLLEPMAWTQDGWPRATGGDLSRPLRKPVPASAHESGTAFSDGFAEDHFGTRLFFFIPDAGYRSKAKVEGGVLRVEAAGSRPQDSVILLLNNADHRYRVTVEVDIGEGATAGLLLFYNKHAFSGLASTDRPLHLYKMGADAFFMEPGAAVGPKAHLRLANDHDVVTFSLSADGTAWRTVASFEVSGQNHNNFDDFLSLRPAIFAMGKGQVAFKTLVYDAA